VCAARSAGKSQFWLERRCPTEKQSAWGVPDAIAWGARVCPDPECGALIFIVSDAHDGSIIESFPPESIDFDSTDLPPAVLGAFKEAVACHAHACYTASVIMVRKTLEEVCADRGASGKNLKERLENLRDKLLLPKEMFNALHDLSGRKFSRPPTSTRRSWDGSTR
jgi:Domain of unknown function (DUF4145)